MGVLLVEVRVSDTSEARNLTLVDRIRAVLESEGWDPDEVVAWSIDGEGPRTLLPRLACSTCGCRLYESGWCPSCHTSDDRRGR